MKTYVFIIEDGKESREIRVPASNDRVAWDRAWDYWKQHGGKGKISLVRTIS